MSYYDGVGYEIASFIIAHETNPEIRDAMERIVDVYENSGYISLSDWEAMSESEKIEEYL